MAITTSQDGQDALVPMYRRLAGALAVVLALAVFSTIFWQSKTWSTGITVAAAVIAAGLLVSGAALFLGRVWALHVLMIYLSLTVVINIWQAVHYLGAPPEWLKGNEWLAAGGFALGMIFLIADLVLLYLSTRPRSRHRFAANVEISVALFLAVVGLANVIAHNDPVRMDFESLGSYRISERSETILKGVEQPITVTVVYTSVDEKRKGTEFAPRVLEQLEEMKYRLRQLRPDATMEIVNVTGDSEKAALLRRLREKMAGQATGHVQLLRSIDNRAETLTKDLQAEMEEWLKLPPDSFAQLWSLSANMQIVLKELSSRVGDLRDKVQREMQGSAVTDFAGLVNDVKTTVDSTKQPLEEIGRLITMLSKIPAEVTKNRASVQESLTKSREAIKAMQDAVGAKEIAPADAGKALQRLAQASQAAQDQLLATVDKLVNVAGRDARGVLSLSRVWVYRQMELPGAYAELAEIAGQMGEQVSAIASRLKPEAQLEQVQALRPYLERMAEMADGANKAAGSALERLAKMDPASQKLLERSGGEKPFEKITAPLQAIQEEIKKLPELKEDSLVRDLGQENIVIVEVGNKVKVASFDEVYPVRVREPGMALNPENEKRVFNGGSAIASKILSTTRRPFATVLMTYLPPDPMMRMRGGGGGITPAAFSTLRRRLEEANFQVGEWDLSQDQPKSLYVCGACGHEEGDVVDAPAKCKQCGAEKRFEKRPQILLVLPPNPPSQPMQPGMPPMPSFGPPHVEKIKGAVDAGTGAIFLAHYAWPSMMGPPVSYPLNEYLAREWGLECQVDYRLIPGEPDDKVPGAYKINLIAFTFMPVSSFTDQPIGEPLQGQKTVWNNACPVATKSPPQGVDVKPVLVVPDGRHNIWATRNLIDLIQQVRSQPGTLIRPKADDIRPPMTLVAAASRAKPAGPETQPATQAATSPAVTPARIVVTGVGMSFVDGYLDEPMPVVGEKTQFDVTDPPLANADLIINSAYWLSGNEGYIATGPVQVKPVNVPPGTWDWLFVLCVIGLPAAVVAAGVLVLLGRRA